MTSRFLLYVLDLILNLWHRRSGMDYLEGELMSELENARLVRLLAKFGFINERPECVLIAT
jgi:hypothetical protein